MATLYLVATPIGNLEDITLRALRILRDVRLIAAEDTRHTKILLTRYEISTPCISYHEHNQIARRERLLAELAQGDVALVSDAGTPLIADPGADLVRSCLAAGHSVVPVPGASALLSALTASGLSAERFAFLGFLPRKSAERRGLLRDAAELQLTLICYEAPHRLRELLSDIAAELPERQLVLAAELTKKHERYARGTAADLLTQLAAEPPRGEYCVVIEGAPTTGSGLRAAPVIADPQAQLRLRLQQLRAEGVAGSAAAKQVARELNLPRSEVYDAWLQLADDEEAD
jgi:16S rRNA (cytidine1402-2'-O)-methyltransferase